MSIIPGIEIAAPERTETSSGSSGRRTASRLCSSSRAMCSSTSSSSPSSARRGRHAGAAGVGRDREAGGNRNPELRHLGEPDALAAEQVPAAVGGLVEVVDVAGHARERRCFSDGSARTVHLAGRTERRRARNSATQASARSPIQIGVSEDVEDEVPGERARPTREPSARAGCGGFAVTAPPVPSPRPPLLDDAQDAVRRLLDRELGDVDHGAAEPAVELLGLLELVVDLGELGVLPVAAGRAHRPDRSRGGSRRAGSGRS